MRIEPTLTILKDGVEATLRSPLPEDSERLLLFTRDLFDSSWRNLNSGPLRFHQMTVEEQETRIREKNLAAGSFFLMAGRGERVLGMLSLSQPPGELNTHCGDIGMGVHPSARSLGVGRAMMVRALEVAEKSGIWNTRLSVRTYNTHAIALYESCGFRRIGLAEKVARIDVGYADEYLYQRIVGPGVANGQ